MTIHIDYDTAELRLRQAVLEKGTAYVFNNSPDSSPDDYWYFDPETGAPGCIVGHVLAYEGLTIEDLGNNNVSLGISALVGRITDRLTCDPRALTLLGAAQAYQDEAVPWGDAVTEAVNSTARRYPADDVG